MAILKISQNPLIKYGNEWLGMRPKPPQYQRRIKVIVPDDVIKRQEVQPVLDAYAIAVKKPEWVGKDSDWYREEQHLSLGFHVISYDDGTPVIRKEK